MAGVDGYGLIGGASQSALDYGSIERGSSTLKKRSCRSSCYSCLTSCFSRIHRPSLNREGPKALASQTVRAICFYSGPISHLAVAVFNLAIFGSHYTSSLPSVSEDTQFKILAAFNALETPLDLYTLKKGVYDLKFAWDARHPLAITIGAYRVVALVATIGLMVSNLSGFSIYMESDEDRYHKLRHYMTTGSVVMTIANVPLNMVMPWLGSKVKGDLLKEHKLPYTLLPPLTGEGDLAARKITAIARLTTDPFTHRLLKDLLPVHDPSLLKEMASYVLDNIKVQQVGVFIPELGVSLTATSLIALENSFKLSTTIQDGAHASAATAFALFNLIAVAMQAIKRRKIAKAVTEAVRKNCAEEEGRALLQRSNEGLPPAQIPSGTPDEFPNEPQQLPGSDALLAVDPAEDALPSHPNENATGEAVSMLSCPQADASAMASADEEALLQG